MLNLLTKSKTRKKIIRLLIYNQDKSYYLREIARLVSASAGNVRRELMQLENNSFVKKEQRGGRVYFKADSQNPLFNDLKNIIDKTIGVEKILENELKKSKGIDFAFLFGSYAKGKFSAASDVDLYVIGQAEEEEIYRAIALAEKEIHREVNYHLAGKEEFQRKLKEGSFHQQILKKFILIIGDEKEFQKLIKRAIKRG